MNPLRHFFHDLALLQRDLRLLSASIFAWGVGESLFFYVIALYLEQLGATPVQIGNICGLGAATTVVTAIPAGILADRWGRKPVMWLGWLAGLAAVALMASTTTLPWFAVGCTQFDRPGLSTQSRAAARLYVDDVFLRAAHHSNSNSSLRLASLTQRRST